MEETATVRNQWQSRSIVHSEMSSMTSAEFVDCAGLPPGSFLEVETKNRQYSIECLGGNAIRISGHPDYCPTPVAGRMLESGLIERGHHLHLLLATRPVTTSRVVRLRVRQAKQRSTIH
jgi:hypothetical protein